MLYWTYGLSYPLPFVISDMFGLDGMGVCGIMEIDTAFLWSYYMVVVVGILFGAYAITFTFYRKLGRWETSSLMTLSEHTRETLIITRNLMRMMKWVLFIPVVFYYPGLTIEAALRLSPGSVATRTARFFMITVPLPHVLDPLVTIFFMKSYRTAVMNLLRGKAKVSAFSDPVQAVPHIGIMKK
uniref:G protein-coupled receptor n=1 Tax=Plectus sambesii TaxID=2011161 RepID=A0A914WA25_9BILA